MLKEILNTNSFSHLLKQYLLKVMQAPLVKRVKKVIRAKLLFTMILLLLNLQH